MPVDLEYIAAGGNRHPSAADWAPGLLAFGAGNNIALWNPTDRTNRGIFALLNGHTDVVNAVKIYDELEGRSLITAGADKTVRVWRASANTFEQVQCLEEHKGSINSISILPRQNLFVTGGADGTVKVWTFSASQARLAESIQVQPRFIPLTSALVELGDGMVVLAVAGTSTLIHLYCRQASTSTFKLQTTLTGHEGWIRSLDFTNESESNDLILASASQDKYIRLWRFRKSSLARPAGSTTPDTKKSMSNKAHQVGSDSNTYNVTFEALLIGHEDWICTVRWQPRQSAGSAVQLLSASADNSLATWEADEASGVWICRTRLGEISSQKGSTTATGSTGGFWIGLWEPSGIEVVSLGRTGAWRRWQYDSSSDGWLQRIGISGHSQEVRGVAWATDGSYVLSTGADQTTRLFAEWKRGDVCSWHEFSRPQIHGYDLNCIDSLTPRQFLSGADEKLLRVFSKPRAIGTLLSNLSGTTSEVNDLLPEGASIPVLGLSNKAVGEDDDVDGEKTNGDDPTTHVHDHALELDQPPLEDHLARQTLWPEHEKLYGHGYEISAVAASHDGSIVATACKASSIDHAVIRLYECQEWREVKPPLSAHNLTVTSLAFSADDQYLLSVSRDRQWTLFRRDSEKSQTFELMASNPKAHSRMILDCCWAPRAQDGDYIFATAGRDKSVKVWVVKSSTDIECIKTLTASVPVTAIAFDPKLAQGGYKLAYGTEDGALHIVQLSESPMEVVADLPVDNRVLPSGPINAIQWRPKPAAEVAGPALAVASDDTSFRILRIQP
ncbi:WD40-repeat-containing domain protein [Neohortaea acidophila]|uniref:Elongator complex protein 2 n=1 Tax=Neohortaea acidophila TaxID=245834 RepID=A0A6A6Q429_9PEZI|nr:WD40-repeat-containing domain protein [Neohortaea acidophila]KAF2486147.1 WD40-repeat-containing domain protein [Neohortaea acidophila]